LVELKVDQLVDKWECKMDKLMVELMVDWKVKKKVECLELKMVVTKEIWKGMLLAVMMVDL